MEIFRMVLLIAVLLAVPFLLGQLFGEKSISGTYIAGVLLLWGSFEAAAMAAVIRGWDFQMLSVRFPYVLALPACAGAAAFCVRMAWRRKSGGKEKGKGSSLREMVMILPAFVLAGSVFFQYAPRLEGWYLVPETVNTILDANSLHGYHPLTGQPLLAPKGIGQSFLNLPAFYACLARWFQVDTKVLLFRLMPLWMLFISFLVFYRFGAFLFGEWKKGRVLVLWVYALVLLLGDKAYMNEAYQMLHYAYEGRAVLTGILLPYCFYLFSIAVSMLLKLDGRPEQGKRHIRVLEGIGWLMEYGLLLLCGLFVMGVDYGLGLLLTMTLLSCFAGAVSLLIELCKRKAKTGGKKQENT